MCAEWVRDTGLRAAARAVAAARIDFWMRSCGKGRWAATNLGENDLHQKVDSAPECE